MNDYELLYLIEEGNDSAKEIMIEKYQNLIRSKIYRFNIHKDQMEDFFQEGCLVLLEAIHKYDSGFGKSFTRFFELLLVRKFLTILKKHNKPLSILSEEIVNSFQIEEEEAVYITKSHVDMAEKVLTKVEFDIFTEHYIYEHKIAQICKHLKLKEKKVYNALYRIKIKLRCFRELS